MTYKEKLERGLKILRDKDYQNAIDQIIEVIKKHELNPEEDFMGVEELIKYRYNNNISWNKYIDAMEVIAGLGK